MNPSLSKLLGALHLRRACWVNNKAGRRQLLLVHTVYIYLGLGCFFESLRIFFDIIAGGDGLMGMGLLLEY